MTVEGSPVTVVGFHGVVVPGRSPGLHAPVAVDAAGRLVDDGGVHPDVVIPTDSWEALPGDGTRIGPWPFVDGNAVITADVPLLRKVRQKFFGRLTEIPALHGFLKSVDLQRGASFSRVPETHVVAWYAPRREIDALRRMIRDVARDQLDEALQAGGDLFIQQSAWALQRAAMSALDDLYAIAALQIANVDPDEAHELREELVRDLPVSKREAAYKVALGAAGALKRKQPTRTNGAAMTAREQVRFPRAV